MLVNHTTFRIGGPARFFCDVKSTEEIKEAVLWARENPPAGGSPYFILGGGSNLLVSDEGYGGLVIKVQSSKFKVQNDNSKLKIETEAGVPLIKIILETTKQCYSGLEWGFGIPGTIGGAICGNAHRLGQAMAQVVESVEILDENLENKILKKEECGFIYGGSRFKKTGEIILSATLIFNKEEQNKIDEVLEQAKKVVREHAPFPSAGCVFKNYEAQKENDVLSPHQKTTGVSPWEKEITRRASQNTMGVSPWCGDLLKEHPELLSRAREGKIGVGYLIDQCGLKGKQIGGAKVWEGHANYIINAGGAKASDIVELINLCKKGVKEKYNIELEEEIRCLGF